MNIGYLLGKTLTCIERYNNQDDNEELIFTTSEGNRCKLYHKQDCCESVKIEDVIGDINDLLNSPITLAEEVSNADENPEGVPKKDYQESFTWTFYKLATIKGYVTIRWYGESNGYYSESVDFALIKS